MDYNKRLVVTLATPKHVFVLLFFGAMDFIASTSFQYQVVMACTLENLVFDPSYSDIRDFFWIDVQPKMLGELNPTFTDPIIPQVESDMPDLEPLIWYLQTFKASDLPKAEG